METFGSIKHRYLDFAAYATDSPCFATWARQAAADPEFHAWVADLPESKQQPNLVFAAARWHGAAAPGPYAALIAVLREQEGPVKATIRSRATQTNEVGRLATLVPVMSLINGPVALIEAGASAGLCLYPDRYDYAWPPIGELRGSGGTTLTATAEGELPVPTRHLDVRWRGGVDLNPLDVRDADAMGWLQTLVWPEHDERRDRLATAIEVAQHEPPELVGGDLLEELPDLVAQAGQHATPVVFHSAVIAYLESADRDRFQDLMAGLVADGACRWISNEGPAVLPRVTGAVSVPPGRFVTALDGVPVAVSHGHGHDLRWLPPSP